MTADEKNQWVRIRGECIESEAKIRGIIQDITDQKRREQQLFVLNRAMRHNLRNDLNVVSGYAEQLQQELERFDIPSELAHDELHDISTNLYRTAYSSNVAVDSLSHIIETIESFPQQRVKDQTETIKQKSEDLVSLGKKANDFTEWIDNNPPFQPVEIVSLIEAVVDDIDQEWGSATCTLDTSSEYEVIADAAGLSLLLEEAIRNAIQHNSGPDPTVGHSG